MRTKASIHIPIQTKMAAVLESSALFCRQNILKLATRVDRISSFSDATKANIFVALI